MRVEKKIVVIADDFTGAAEIGGIGLRHGLRVAIETEAVDNNNIDLLVIATDTRTMSAQQAAQHIAELVKKIMTFEPYLVYKKIDSVLRGNVSEELESQLNTMGLKRSIIIAANPVFKRIIKDGKYYIDDVPLEETCFSTDSQYPIQSNDVLRILTPSIEYPIVSKKTNDFLPEKGLIMGDVESLDDLRKWTLKSNSDTLFAGASGFFNSLLITLQLSKQKGLSHIPAFGKKALFILGSSYPKEKDIIDKMVKNGHHHSNMPKEIYENKQFDPVIFNNWVHDVVNELKNNNKVIVSSIHSHSQDPDIFLRIKQTVGKLVTEVFEHITPDEILIEGGSTTSEILDKLNIKKLIPIQELDMGVIRMKVSNSQNLCLTTKPGSYSWPETVWVKEEIDKLNKETLVNVKSHE